MQLNKTMSIAIMSGKGGVGKTNLALNLARMLSLASHPALLVDCDLGLANVDVLLGLDTTLTLQDVVNSDANPKDVIMNIEKGFDLLPAASGLPGLVEMDNDMQALLFHRLSSCMEAYNYLFLDLGAGISPAILSFASMAHMRIVIITPEPTSITDGYAVMKVMNAQYGIKDFHVLVNQVESKWEYDLASKRICEACNHFLGFRPQVLGQISQDKAVLNAVLRQVPFTLNAPNCPASKNVQTVAQRLIELRLEKKTEIQKGVTKNPLRNSNYSN